MIPANEQQKSNKAKKIFEGDIFSPFKTGPHIMISSLFSNQHQAANRSQALRRLNLLRVLILGFATLFNGLDYFVLSLGLNHDAFAFVITLGFGYSALIYLRLKRKEFVTDYELFFHLIVDSLIILTLVAISGRTANPFIYYLLVLVAISAVLFEKKASWLFSSLTIIIYTSLLYLDIKDHTAHRLNDFQLHLVGMWANFVGSTVLINFFISTLATALRDREILLAQAREKNLKNEQIVGIGTIAASTVHALRTPLSTIAVLLSDLKSDSKDAQFVTDIDLLLEQVERCKTTTNKLARLADISENENLSEEPEDLFEFMKEHYLLINPRILPGFHLHSRDDECLIPKNILLHQAIMNLVDNAIDAAKTRVEINFKSLDTSLLVEILDDGDGMPAEIAENWGQPFLSEKQDGLGIGIFLANSTIERIGGKVSLSSGDSSSGSRLEISIPFINSAN